MNSDPFYTESELRAFGFERVGRNVRVSRKCSLYAISGFLGSNVRVDDFCILKGRIEVGDFVHVCAFCSLSGVAGTVRLSDFSTVSNRVSIFTGSDDYRADALSSSTVPPDTVVTIKGDVVLERAALVGAHSVLLPGATLGAGASVGALCVVRGAIPAGQIVVSGAAGLAVKGQRDVNAILAIAERVQRDFKATP